MTQRLEEYDVIPVDCDRIYYDGSFNCRGEFTLQSVESLADSISGIGRLLYPLWVQPASDAAGVPEGFDFRLIAGHRRYRSVTVFLKWAVVPVMVFRGLTEWQARKLNFTENLERQDLNPLEEALAIKNMPWPDGMSVRNVAQELKRPTRWAHARLRILALPEAVQQLVAARRVTLLDLEIVCRKELAAEQIKVAEAIAASKRGRGKNAVFVGEKLTRSFRRRRSKSEINSKVAMMLNLGLEVKQAFALRMGAWCAGSISDDEFDANILAEAGVIKSTDSCSESDGRAADH